VVREAKLRARRSGAIHPPVTRDVAADGAGHISRAPMHAQLAFTARSRAAWRDHIMMPVWHCPHGLPPVAASVCRCGNRGNQGMGRHRVDDHCTGFMRFCRDRGRMARTHAAWRGKPGNTEYLCGCGGPAWLSDGKPVHLVSNVQRGSCRSTFVAHYHHKQANM
jgi:hypothetical protein